MLQPNEEEVVVILTSHTSKMDVLVVSKVEVIMTTLSNRSRHTIQKFQSNSWIQIQNLTSGIHNITVVVMVIHSKLCHSVQIGVPIV